MGIEIILGCLLFSGMVMGTTATVARVITDGLTTARASKAGAWDFLENDRTRRDAKWAGRREAASRAWAATRERRHRQAGGTGQYKPGLRAYAGDVYTGWWEDRLANRQAKREHRGPVTWSPDRKPWHVRVDEAVALGADRARMAWQTRGNQTPAAEVTATTPAGRSSAAPLATDPRIACQDCGQTLTNRAGSWEHPSSAVCPSRPTAGPTAEKPPEAAADPGDGIHSCPRCARPTHHSKLGFYCDTCDRVWDNKGKSQGQQVCDICDLPGYVADIRPLTKRNPGRHRFPVVVHYLNDSVACPTADQVRAADDAESAILTPAAQQEKPSHRSAPTGADTPTTGGSTMTQSTVPATTEVYNNEDARIALGAVANAAAEAQDALGVLEAAKAKLQAAANGTLEGMSGKRFDSQATTSAAAAADAINVGDLAEWSEKFDTAEAEATNGLRALDKYLDAEELVSANNVDATTLQTN